MPSVFRSFLNQRYMKRSELKKKSVNNATVLAMVVVTDTEVCLSEDPVMQLTFRRLTSTIVDVPHR